MTCYLNSLIQSLYMTPEFRNAVFRWEYKASSDKKSSTSIPHQLQKLFVLLQTTDRENLETKDLTTSFGWTSAEAYDQHDVQELCRLMFDALEMRWKGTQNEKLIQSLYRYIVALSTELCELTVCRGTMQDFVKCLKCGKENMRQDFFLDLPLAIKPFGATSAFSSIEEALSAFVTPELLTGSNKYFCEQCNSKQDAHKGLRVTAFPYLLTIQLKRFDFDYNTMQRIKLNDRMAFPDVLNLNPFVVKDEKAGRKSTDEATNSESGETQDEELQENDENQPPAASSTSHSASADGHRGIEGFGELGTQNSSSVAVGEPLDKELIKKYQKEGEYVYELYSIMMHQGNAAGGHYFAYIKNMEQDHWYCFNDTRVEVAKKEDIEKSFGGSAGGWSYGNQNAYMLMYRKIDPSKNVTFTKTKSLPRHMLQLLEQWKSQEEEEERQRQYIQSLTMVTVRLNIPCDSQELLDGSFQEEIPKTKTLDDVFNMATKFFEERAKKNHGIHLKKNCARFILCNTSRGVKPLCAYVSKADRNKPLEQLLEASNSTRLELLLDYRLSPTFHDIISFSGKMIRVSVVDIANRSIRPYFYVHVPENFKIIQVKQRIGFCLNDSDRVSVGCRLVVEKNDSPSMGVHDDFVLLDKNVPFFEIIEKEVMSTNPMVYYDGGYQPGSDFERIATEDRQKRLTESTMFSILDRRKFAMMLRVRFPSQEEVSRAASVCDVYASTDVADMNDVTMESVDGEETSSVQADSATDPGEDDAQASMGPGYEMSGRCSDADPGETSDIEMRSSTSSGSGICNSTPQVSPAVSDVDDNAEMDPKFCENLSAKMENFVDYERPLNLDLAGSNYGTGMGMPFASSPFTGPSAATASTTSATPTTKSMANSDTATIVPIGDVEKRIVIKSSDKNLHVLDVDKRMTVAEFKQWASEQLRVSSDHFVLFKHYVDNEDDKGFEQGSTNESLDKALTSNAILSVKMRPPLKENEKLVHVHLFDTNDPVRDNWKQLFDVAISQHMTFNVLTNKCIRLYNEFFGVKLHPVQVRLREAPDTKLKRYVLRLNDQVGSREMWTSDIYMQILSEPVPVQKRNSGDPIMLRRFRPSTLEVSPIHEVFIDDQSNDQATDLARAIAAVINIPSERIFFVDVTAWERWPYTKNRLDMLNGKIRFMARLPQPKIVEKYGNAVIYYKDCNEVPKELSEEEKKEIAIKDAGGAAIINRRKERPLRIQMSSVSEA
ncbi:hypothetical protein WR25_26698 isoform E [Diploscapter pachys]|nr:hypothetical protein WR25_26698 isoform E [Diploscapter pachys]